MTRTRMWQSTKRRRRPFMTDTSDDDHFRSMTSSDSTIRASSSFLGSYALDGMVRTWWRTTPVATKTRYHGARGALLRARIYPLIFISLFLYYELLTRTCLSGSSLISLSLLSFRVGSSLFGIPVVKPIFLCEPYLFL